MDIVLIQAPQHVWGSDKTAAGQNKGGDNGRFFWRRFKKRLCI